MLFTDLTFLCFHLAVVVLRWSLPRRAVGPMLLVSSYVFYLSAGPRYALLIGGTTIFAWWVALSLERSKRKALLIVAVTVLLGVLAYFKYAGFLVAQGSALVRLLGGHANPPRMNIALPLAISFFSFELISYVADVYRGAPAERSLWRFALYIAYYPHLIAGPIVRANELLPSLHRLDRFDGRTFSDGVFIALIGFVKKGVLADRLAHWADAVFADPGAHSTAGVWMGVVAYTGQIFCDFSGYTDIARGSSLMLGFPLPDNFDWPYLSTSITEFWRRWHMTLSRWLRDYLYISLGGNRVGVVKQYRNLLITMLLGGLWHGANWTFVAWGAWHGLLLAGHKLWRGGLERSAAAVRVSTTVPYRVVAAALTLLTVMIGWVLFRSPTFLTAAQVIARMVRAVPGTGDLSAAAPLPEAMQSAATVTVALAIGHLLGSQRVGLETNRVLPPIARGLYWAALATLCYLFSESRATFIYFQF